MFKRKSSPYFAAKRQRPPRPVQQWRVAALAVATGTARQPWESDAHYARRLAAEARLATRRARAEAAAGVSRWVAHAVGGGSGASGSAATLESVRPLPDTHLEGRICVYVIQSTTVPRLVYVGFSTDADKRLRKHNGELSGGARYTTHGRPWRTIVRIYGFPSKVEALQLERALTYPEHSRHARELLLLGDVAALVASRQDPSGLKARLAQMLMHVAHFCALPLRVVWSDGAAMQRHGLAGRVCVFVLRGAAHGQVRVGCTIDADRCIAQYNGGASGNAWLSLLRVTGFASLDEAREFAQALVAPAESRHARPLLALPVVATARPDTAGRTVRLAQLLMCAERFCRTPLVVSWQCARSRDEHEIEFGDSE